MLGNGAAVGGEPVRMTRELPIPIRAYVASLQQGLVDEAETWAQHVAEVRDILWVSGDTRPGWRLDRACGLLADSVSVLLALREQRHLQWQDGRREIAVRDGLDGAITLLDLHHKVRLALGVTKLVHRLPVPCPRCSAMRLEREDGTDIIDCRDCHRRFTFEEYERLCLALADRKLAVG